MERNQKKYRRVVFFFQSQVAEFVHDPGDYRGMATEDFHWNGCTKNW